MDYLLAYKYDLNSTINLEKEGLPFENDVLPNWVKTFCPDTVKHFRDTPLFTWSPGYEIPFPTLHTSESAMLTTCMLRVVDTAARRANVKWMLQAGSLLGAALHGGPIPWDDDADILIDINGKEEFFKSLAVLSSEMGVNLQFPFMNNAHKLFDANTPSTLYYPELHWPFIDIFFYDAHPKSSSICELAIDGTLRMGEYCMETSRVFPLRKYFFGGVHLPGPWDRTLMKERYDFNKCMLPRGNHRLQYGGWNHASVLDCCRLSEILPFIKTVFSQTTNLEYEYLMVGSQVSHVSVFSSNSREVLLTAIPDSKNKNGFVRTASHVDHRTKWSMVAPDCIACASKEWHIPAEDRAIWSRGSTKNGIGAKLTSEIHNLNYVEIDNTNSASCLATSNLNIVNFNAQRGTDWMTLAHMIRGTHQDLNADIIILNEMDIGMARTGNVHTACLLANALQMNYAWGLEFVELTNGNNEEQESTKGRTNLLGLHGNAILSKCPFDDRSAKIVRDKLLSEFYSNKPSFTNANGYEKRLGGRMGLFINVLLGSNNSSLTVGSLHKLESKESILKVKELLHHRSVIMGGDEKGEHCTAMGVPPANKVEQPTVPVVPSCHFHETRKHQGDRLCSNMVSSNFTVHMPCKHGYILSDHAILSLHLTLSKS